MPSASVSPRRPIATPEAPAAVGPYSQAIAHGDLLFCSGALPLDPSSGAVAGGSVAEETARCLRNLEAICVAAGTALGRAVRLTVYTTDLGEFAAINAAFAALFGEEPPARVAVGVAALPKGARVEIDAIVALDEP